MIDRREGQAPPLQSWRWLCDGSGFEAVGRDVDGRGCDFGDAGFGIAVGDGGMRFGGGLWMKSADGLVATGVLGFVKGAVGNGEDLFIANVDRGIHVPREGGPSNRDGAVHRKAGAFDLERLASNGGEDARGQRSGFLALAKTGDDQEFFAAPADQYIGISNC